MILIIQGTFVQLLSCEYLISTVENDADILFIEESLFCCSNELSGKGADRHPKMIVVSWQLRTFQFILRSASFQEGEITNDIFEADFNGLDVYCTLLPDQVPHL